jgi:tetratricopeptide (TPR) repeat protein
MAGIEKVKKSGKPGAEAVKLFKAGEYEKAINEFTTFLITIPDDENKKVAHYNRGMAHYNLGQYDMALEDGESCLKIDPFWIKGYKCKGLALEGLGKPDDAIDALLNGQKMCSSHGDNTDTILNPLIERLNLVSDVVVACSVLKQ